MAFVQNVMMFVLKTFQESIEASQEKKKSTGRCAVEHVWRIFRQFNENRVKNASKFGTLCVVLMSFP